MLCFFERAMYVKKKKTLKHTRVYQGRCEMEECKSKQLLMDME